MARKSKKHSFRRNDQLIHIPTGIGAVMEDFGKDGMIWVKFTGGCRMYMHPSEFELEKNIVGPVDSPFTKPIPEEEPNEVDLIFRELHGYDDFAWFAAIIDVPFKIYKNHGMTKWRLRHEINIRIDKGKWTMAELLEMYVNAKIRRE